MTCSSRVKDGVQQCDMVVWLAGRETNHKLRRACDALTLWKSKLTAHHNGRQGHHPKRQGWCWVAFLLVGLVPRDGPD